MVDQQAAQRPEAIALVHGKRRVSYGELVAQANQLSHYLHQQGVRPDMPVGVCFNRGCDMIIAMLAILKAGGAFLPLDPDYPAERLNYMLRDSGCQWLLRDSEQAVSFATPPGVTAIDLATLALADYPTDGLGITQHPEQLAYTIYTSGSTGQPKGVNIAHGGLTMHVQTIGQRYGMTPEDVELHFASVSFDGAVERWTVPLAFGSRLVIRDQQLWSAEQTCEALVQEGVTIACFPPSYGGPLLDWIDYRKPALKVRSWTLGGEAFTRDTYERLQQVLNPPRIINGYGPTETVVTPMIWEAYPETKMSSAYAPIGTGVGERRLYVLDNALNLAPIGVAGELYIGGEVGLARGYHERPGLTAERFLPDLYGAAGERMYRTGDVVRWRTDGVMEYLGRSDQQIKIRGFRIELGEIETQLQQWSEVEHVAVVAHDAPGGKRLVGYLQGPVAGQSEESQVLQQMAQGLPDYMVPSRLIWLDKLPLTPAGKIDRNGLAAPQWEAGAQGELTPVEGDREQLLAQVWQELLGVSEVGRESHFFALGGHSLLATRLVAQLKRDHQVELALPQVFDNPLLQQMATHCQQGGASLPLQVVPRQPYMPVSTSQQRLWFMQQLEPQNTAFNMPVGLNFKGLLDVPRLQQALHELAAAHEVFQLQFVQHQGELVQQLSGARLLPITMLEDDESERDIWLKPFDLAQDSLIRVGVKKCAEHHWQVVIVQHHIISDGVSMGLLLSELKRRYLGEAVNRAEFDYLDYCHWQQTWLQSQQAKDSLQWWQQQLQQDIEPLALEPDLGRSNEPAQGALYRFDISPELAQQVGQTAQQFNATEFTLYLTLWQLLLHKYTQQSEIRVGVPVAGRTEAGTESLLGCFINVIVMPAKFDGPMDFAALLTHTTLFSRNALSHQNLPFERLVEVMASKGQQTHHPLYQSVFNLQQVQSSALQDWPNLEVSLLEPKVGQPQLDLSFEVHITEGGEQFGVLAYDKGLFSQDYIAQLSQHLLALLAQVTEQPERNTQQISLLSERQQDDINAINQTHVDWGGFVSVSQQIQQQAMLTPEANALAMGETQLNYREFNLRVNQLAQYLRQRGVNIDSYVAVAMPRCIDLIIAIHAIVRAGGAYVPVDLSLPSERINYILQQAEVELALTLEGVPFSADSHTETVKLDALDLSAMPAVAPEVNWHPQQAMYVIFTSGSTGKPKGVVNHQLALQNRLRWMQQAYPIDGHDVVLQKTPIGFDVSVWELFWPFMVGAQLAVADPEAHREPLQLLQQMQTYQVSHVHFVPSMLHAMVSQVDLAQSTALRRIICSGEALPPELANQIITQLPNVELHNLYGPTEAAIDVSYWPCQQLSSKVPIGLPISNIQLHVLDEYLLPVPAGVPGELYIAGEGLAREYRNRADLTAERFMPNPFSQQGGRMYRTGDKVIRRQNGVLDYLGRLDQQVKLRGLRIELEEIEACLNKVDGVQESAVIVSDSGIGEQLVAYLVTETLTQEQEHAINGQLAQQLPSYMVPALYLRLDDMPLSPNGKRDRKALPQPQWQAVSYRAPESELEVWLANQWQQHLALEQVGLDDNFFALGGHSLLATKILADIRQDLGVDLSLQAFFAAASLQHLADEIAPSWQQNQSQEQAELDEMAALMDELELL
ncbi:amino acid adenylation domain-containing protein [Motilimonas pumila]|uniref:Amino acid adenylation domain-containing protein n=1 Tax=Motilimonas pumila TaxID=2303987 RepID=A0A418Y9E8_9GAMM|nr:amino acid adenylation domain-containing protein [Motilimonas pumila]